MPTQAKRPALPAIVLGMHLALLMSTSLTLAAEALGRFAPAESAISTIEMLVALPKGAAPLSSYIRSYSGRVIEGRRKIEALYERGSPRIRILRPTEDLPVIFDGGCDVLELMYDVEAQNVEYVRCHGVA